MPGIKQRKVRKLYKKATDRLHEALATPITIYYKTGETENDNRGAWDNVNNEPWNPNAGAMEGSDNVFMDEIKTKVVEAIVTPVGTNDKFMPLKLPAGEIDRTEVQLGFKIADVLIDPKNTSGPTILHRLEKVVIHGETYIGKTSPFKHSPTGQPYRCFIICSLDSTQ